MNIQMHVVSGNQVRTEFMKSQFERSNFPIPYQFIKSFTPSDSSDFFDIENFNHEVGTLICCLRSHLLALSIGLNSNSEYIIISEDDICFVDDFEDKLNKIIENWNSEIDYISLSYLPLWLDGSHIHLKLKELKSIDDLYYGFTNVNFTLWGSQCYIIKRESIQKILNILGHSKLSDLISECKKLFTLPSKANKGEEIIIDSILPRFLNQGFTYPMLGMETYSKEIISSAVTFNQERIDSWEVYKKFVNDNFSYKYYHSSLIKKYL